ncbi:MAG: glycosyltransferase family 2 protein [Candidatus Margulisbacteria bacterium]|nr:glycosyltransferase family 2 protein [Candidatus Margulisiibacteriota bacterium]
MKLSIIVPAYNEEKSIGKTLEGLKNQSYKDLEIIVIDNNSKDKTSEIAKQHVDKVYLETQQGYIYAVIRGAKEASGELITFCDADTVYPRDWAEKAVKPFMKNSKVVAVYGTCATFDSGKISSFFNYLGYTVFLMVSRTLGLDNTSGFNFIMRKSAYDKVGGYDPAYKKMSPDIELGKRLKITGNIKFLPSLKVSSSIRRFKEKGKIKTFFMFAKAWWSMLRNKLPDVDYAEYNKVKK